MINARLGENSSTISNLSVAYINEWNTKRYQNGAGDGTGSVFPESKRQLLHQTKQTRK